MGVKGWGLLPRCCSQVFGVSCMDEQSRQSARLLPQSSELGLPHRQVGVPPCFRGGGHTRLGERDGGGPISDKGTYTVVL